MSKVIVPGDIGDEPLVETGSGTRFCKVGTLGEITREKGTTAPTGVGYVEDLLEDAVGCGGLGVNAMCETE